ncbi:serine hydrolase, partial [Streptomyces sp. SID3212]
ASVDGGAGWRPVPFTTVRTGVRDSPEPRAHPAGSVGGWSGRVWHRVAADLTAWRGGEVRLRWRYDTGRPHSGRGVYVDGLRVGDGGRVVFDEAREGDTAGIEAVGWVASED